MDNRTPSGATSDRAQGSNQNMWLRDFFSSLLRLWYVVVGGLLLTGFLCYQLFGAVAVTYQIRGSQVLMPPPSLVGVDGNPYLFLGGMNQALDILAAKVSSAEVAKPILDAYPGATFVAEPDRTTSGSVFRVTVTGTDVAEAVKVRAAVMDAVPVALTAMQDQQNIPKESRLGITLLVADDDATPNTKSRSIVVLGAGAVGAAFSILLAGFIDGRLLARRTRAAGGPRGRKGHKPAQDRVDELTKADDGRLTSGDHVAVQSPKPHSRSRAKLPVEPRPPAEERVTARRRSTARIPG